MDLEIDHLNRGQLLNLRCNVSVKLSAAYKAMNSADASVVGLRDRRVSDKTRDSILRRHGDGLTLTRHLQRQMARISEMIAKREAEGKGVGW